MTIQKEKVTITLPKALLEAVRKQTTARGQSQFIADAIAFYLAAQQQDALVERLAAGYRANAERDQAIASEWAIVEDEAWAAIEDEASRP